MIFSGAADMLGWHVNGQAAYDSNEETVQLLEEILRNPEVPALIEKYYMSIGNFTFDLSTGTLYASYMAPLHEGDKAEVKHSRPILNFSRRQNRRVKRAAQARLNYELAKEFKKQLRELTNG